MAPRTSSRLAVRAKLRVAPKIRKASSANSSNTPPDEEAQRPQKRLKTRHVSATDAGPSSSSSTLHHGHLAEQKKGQTAISMLNVAKCDSGVLTKRDRATSKGKKRNRVDMFTKLPLDVLLEIFQYLHPLSLLHVSYTSKVMRSMLTADYATLVWKMTYATNIQPNYFAHNESSKYPPECPSGVDIRHYTSVLFGETCLFCTHPNATVVHWGALTRLCEKCASENFIDAYDLEDDAFEISRLCWFSGIGGDVGLGISGRGISGRGISGRGISGEDFLGTLVLKHDLESQRRALQICADDDARDRYSAMQYSLRRQIDTNFTRPLKLWGDLHERERRASIFERVRWLEIKLTAEGYTYDDFGKWRYKFRNLPLIQNRLPLNDDGWNRIKYKAVQIFECERQNGRENAMITKYKERLSFVDDQVKQALKTSPKPWIYPTSSTLAKSGRISCVIKSIEGNNDDREIKAKLSTDAGLNIPNLLNIWRIEADKFLARLLTGKTTVATNADEDVDCTPLMLATAFFKCRFCTDPISYPRILMHKCLRTRRKIISSGKADAKDEAPAAFDSNEYEPHKVHGVRTITEEGVWHRMPMWSGPTWDEARQFISVDETAVKSAKVITRACGEDPGSVTAQAMKDRKVWLECRRCGLHKSKGTAAASCPRHIMTWNMAILHDVSVHPDNISWRSWSLVASPSNLALAEARESKFSSSTAAGHLIRKHKITDLTALEDHVYMQLDIPMKAYSCVVKI
ncbi:hypothetical protein BDN70DRAFT_989905 [Pholiota conissans]|uniref:F-box domain-containing protein n=1 Tax=Pholiota conissans TaxID=109636 RepID=A0A9P5ZAJ3_9AGAR|nr:hypothetical protein BDN70DRAFT_989905 [Pholiota conissans]